jgi:hypothetical protein
MNDNDIKIEHYKWNLNNVLHKGEYLGTCLLIHWTQINVSHIKQTFF